MSDITLQTPEAELGQKMTSERAERPQITSFRELRALLREDYAANGHSGRKWTFWTPGFQAVAVYRISAWALTMRPRLLRRPVIWLTWPLNLFIRNVYGIELPPKTQIGRRFAIAHQHGIVIHHRAVIGDDCSVRQGVTIGAARGGKRPPVLGNRVQVGAGAVIADSITIGDDVNIGPNAVVMTNVPAGSIVTPPRPRIMPPPPGQKTSD